MSVCKSQKKISKKVFPTLETKLLASYISHKPCTLSVKWTFEYAGHVAARQTQEVAKYNDGNQDKIVLAEILESEAAAN